MNERTEPEVGIYRERDCLLHFWCKNQAEAELKLSEYENPQDYFIQEISEHVGERR